MILDGIDPLAHKRQTREIPYFGEYARELHAKIKHQWKNPKHAQQWLSSLETYAMPIIGEIRLNRIDAPLVRQVLTQIWYEKPETARRVRQRIAQVLDAAAADGFRSGSNPAPSAMAGLAKVKQVQGHHAAMPYLQIPKFLLTMRATDMHPLSKLALEFIVLTAARTSEVLKAEWAEVDFEARLWSVPGHRMKAGRLHEVP
ncbi:MAG: integrase, partial [Pseudomonadota bacterium]